MGKTPSQIMFADEHEGSAENVAQPVNTGFVGNLEALGAAKAAAQMNAAQQTQQTQQTLQPVQTKAAETPSMILDLPSAGKFGYPAEVKYRDILAKDEELLASATEETYSRVMNSVIKSVLMDCEFYEELTIPDRDYALMWLWANNYDPVKKTEIDCQNCEKSASISIDITKVEVVPPKQTIKGEPFTGTFNLPLKNGHTITVRLAKVKDELFAEQYSKKNKDINFETIMISQTIEPITPLMTLDKHIKWVQENVRGHEMSIVRQFHETYNYGIESRMEHTCDACGEVTPFTLPFSIQDILYPTVSYDFS